MRRLKRQAAVRRFCLSVRQAVSQAARQTIDERWIAAAGRSEREGESERTR